jgi:hypothetical protein
MPDLNPEKLRLAPASVYFDNAHLGYVSFENPIEIEDESKGVELKAGQEGDTPVDIVLTGHSCLVRVPLVEVTPEKLALTIPNSELAGGVVTIKNRIGTRLRAEALELKIVILVAGEESVDPDDIFIFPLATPAPGTITQSFSAQRQQELSLSFRVWPDPTTKAFYSVGG